MSWAMFIGFGGNFSIMEPSFLCCILLLLHCSDICHGPWLAIALYFMTILIALLFVWQRNVRHIAELYGSQLSLHGVEEYRRLSGLQSISSTCFKAARISTILIDDGIEYDKKHDIEWHKSFATVVGRILRIERLAEKILDEVIYFSIFTLLTCIGWYSNQCEQFVNVNACLWCSLQYLFCLDSSWNEFPEDILLPKALSHSSSGHVFHLVVEIHPKDSNLYSWLVLGKQFIQTRWVQNDI